MAFSKFCLFSTLANYSLFVLVFLGSAVLFFIGKPFERGFFCDDDSIKYPFKSPTINNLNIYLVSFFFPLITLIFGEVVHILLVIRQKETEFLEPKISKAKIVIEQTSNLVAVFLFGFAATQFSFDILKYSIGRLRPHFLDVCKPGPYNCTGEYIEKFVCTGQENDVNQARLSFPSGHAALSMYAMLFLILFIQERLYFRPVPLLKPFLQILCFYITLYCGSSRIFDYWHHPTDVIAGFILGIVTSIVTVMIVAHGFKSAKEIHQTEMMLTADTMT